MRDQADETRRRLRELRERSGLSLRAMAKELGYGDRWTTYRAYEEKHKRPYLPVHLVQQLVPILTDRGEPPITPEEVWSLSGVIPGAEAINDTLQRARQTEQEPRGVIIREVDVSPAAGGGSLSEGPEGGDGDREVTLASWTIPKPFLEHYLPDTSGLAVVRVIGNSMEPAFTASDRVLVDTTHRVVSHDGVYVLWNGVGVVIKQLQMIPNSNPPRVRIISVNPTYPTDEVLLSEVVINGRVVGKWMWQ